MNFYDKTLKNLLLARMIATDETVLVVGGGESDRNVFFNNGFTKVLISNLEFDRGVDDYSPFSWEFQDMEGLSCKDESYDWVFVYAGLHHCSSPHRALCEMLRVSKKGIGVFEGRQSLLNKVSVSLGLVPAYELEPLVLSVGRSGGLRNSNIPNFIYRWTENEVEKTVNSYLPHFKHNFWYYYGYTIPLERLSMSPSLLKRSVGKLAQGILPFFKILFPKQGNHFAFVVSKKGKLQPWLAVNDKGELEFVRKYATENFNPTKYTGRHKYEG